MFALGKDLAASRRTTPAYGVVLGGGGSCLFQQICCGKINFPHLILLHAHTGTVDLCSFSSNSAAIICYYYLFGTMARHKK